MFSLNYKNNVIKSILKEELDQESVKIQKTKILNYLDKIYTDTFRNHFYILKNKDDQNTVTIVAPFDTIQFVPYESDEQRNNIKSKLHNKYTDCIDLNDKPKYGIISYIKCKKIIIHIMEDSLYYDTDKCLCIADTLRDSMSEFERCMEKYFGDRLSLYNLKTSVDYTIDKTYKKYNKNQKEIKKQQALNMSNINIDSKVKEIELIDKDSITKQKGDIEAPNDNDDYYSYSNKDIEHKRPKLSLDPQHLIRSNNYLDMNQIGTTVENSLKAIKEDQKNNMINYIACSVIGETMKTTIGGNASTKNNLITDDVASIFLKKYKLDDKKYEEILKDKDAKRKIKNTIKIKTLDNMYNNANGFSVIKQISTKPVEILSPIVLANMDSSIKWGKDGDMTSNQIIEKLFGRNNMKKALISYPMAGTQFFDSYMAIPSGNGYKMMKVSTKGGINSEGASASVNSLYKMLIEYDGTKRYPDNDILTKLATEYKINRSNINQFFQATSLKFTPYAKALARLYPEETAFLLIFGGTEPKNHESIFTSLKKNRSFNVDYSKCKTISEFIRSSNSLDITGCVIQLLNYQKYDISQINCTPRIDGNDFWYEYSIQYPAHFSGTVALEKGGKGVHFHILASK